MADSPLKQKIDLPSIGITVDGTELPGSYEVTEIEIEKDLNKIPTARVVILDGDPSKQSFEISESGPFKPGAEIVINLGYHQENEQAFKGVVVSHALKVRTKNISELIVDCVDKAKSLTMSKNSKFFPEMTDSDIISQILGEHGVAGEVAATTGTHETMIHFYSSDWDFVLSRAEANGLVVAVDDGVVNVVKPEDAEDCGVSASHGQDIIKMDAKVDASKQVKSVTAKSWDFSTNSMIEVTANEPTPPSQGDISSDDLSGVFGQDLVLQSPAPLDQDMLQAWADAYLKNVRFGKIKGSVRFQGHIGPKPNTTITLEGLGSKMNGTGYIGGIRHRYYDSQWTTDVKLGLDPDWGLDKGSGGGGGGGGAETTSGSGQLPGTNGLYIGTVKQIDSDPQGEFRVLVDIPAIIPTGDGVWARMMKFYATGDAGLFFYPETGDEVVLGFLGDDVRYPVILGAVYSKTHSAAYTPDDENRYKALVTRNQLVIEFDDIDLITTILTPNGNTMVFSDLDQKIQITDETGNDVLMDPAGITMYTPKDLSITVDGKTSLESTGEISIKSSADVKIEGINVSSKASAKNSMEGAQAEVKGSAQTTVKGGVVMIN